MPERPRLAPPLDVILQADAIRLPLTGIGRYATELARALQRHEGVSRLRFFGMASWVDDPFQALDPSAAPQARPLADDTRRAWLRSHLAGNRLAVRAYHALVPRWNGWQLRKEGASLYHAPNYFLPPFPGPSVATVHDLSHLHFPQFHPVARVDYLHRALPDTLRRATHLLTDAESVRQDIMASLGWPADRVTAVPLGVDPVFHPRPRDTLAPWLARHGLVPQGYSLYVGTIEPRKNVDGLLDAYEQLPAALRLAFPLVLAGGAGWQSQATHARMGRAVRAGWARYLDYVPQAELPLLYAGARAFAFPSHYEGFGLPVLEAMASGVPVVTSNASSLPEVVGDSAPMVAPQDIDGLSQALAELLEDDGLWARRRIAALARARVFSWERCAEETVAVYRRTVAGWRG